MVYQARNDRRGPAVAEFFAFETVRECEKILERGNFSSLEMSKKNKMKRKSDKLPP